MEKVLVYGETVREARRFYIAKAGQSVGCRTYEDFNNGEKCDIVIFVDESKRPSNLTRGKDNGKRK